MKRRTALSATLSGLAVCLLGVSVLVPLRVAAAHRHYPDAVAVASEGIDFDNLRWGAIGWQTKYLTQDDLTAVRAWYGARLGVAPASDMNLGPVDGCVWLTQARLVILVTHTATVMACAAPGGTRITVNESVRPGP